MTVANKVSDCLNDRHINYNVVEHEHSQNSITTARNSQIAPTQIVKAVMLEDKHGHHLMAILTASHKISLNALNQYFNRQFCLMKEADVYHLFEDCEHGAVPPLAQAYNIDRVYENQLLKQSTLYLEAGDHSSLISITQHEFRKLMENATSLAFSHRVFH